MIGEGMACSGYGSDQSLCPDPEYKRADRLTAIVGPQRICSDHLHRSWPATKSLLLQHLCILRPCRDFLPRRPRVMARSFR